MEDPQDQQVELAPGVAWREVLVLEDDQRSTLDVVLQHLGKIYGDNTPLTTLMSRFYARNQHRHETIRQYSLCLEELLQQILKHPSSLPDKDKTLRDRFIEGISSNSIKMELRREVRKDSDINFKDIKDEALELEGAIRMDSAEVITAELHQVGIPTAPVQSTTPKNPAFQEWQKTWRQHSPICNNKCCTCSLWLPWQH
ncbi:hypothetical protein BSL78_08379 [Apostichopus japonicus]|uniref:Retrotransposon gag domain-containing protein n=1 Tax=Stichopus japonicus TaxID=307972 RepID=A0A2G8L3A5_STIJA|nr:hypothetical protein BSL78_08379 [Apostichopus japonicus]